MTDTLTDRYVDAAMRTVPERQRADLAAELRASIDDQIDAAVAAGEPQGAAERAVLTDLGDPDKLAAGYTGRQLQLIGPRYYLDWWRVLKLLLWIVPAATAFAIGLGQLIQGSPVGTVIAQMVIGALTAVLHVAFWTTLVFVILERTGHETMDAGPWTPDRLPEPRRSSAGFGELVASLVWLLILAGATVWDHFLGLAYVGGRWMPVLDPALWPWWIAAFLAVLAAEAVVGVVVYVRGGWTFPLAIVHGILDLLAAAAALAALATGHLVNPQLVTALANAGGADLPRILAILGGICVAAIALWDALDGFRKARRARIG